MKFVKSDRKHNPTNKAFDIRLIHSTQGKTAK